MMFSTNPDLPQPQNTFQINQDDKFFTKLLSRETTAFSSPPPPPSTEYGRLTATIPFDWESQPGTPKDTTATGNKSPCRIPLPPPPSHQYFSEISAKNFSYNSKSIKLRQSRSLLFSTLLGKLISIKKNLKITSAKTSPSYLPPSLSSNSSRSWSSSTSTSFFVSGSKYNGRRKSRFASPESSFDSKTEDEDEDEGANGSPTSTLCFATRNFRLSECYRGKS